MNLNGSEWKLMRALWARGPSGVAELHATLEDDTGWAYSTVKTLLERLAEKGAVTIEAARGGRRFRAALAETDARRSAFRALLDRAFGGRVDALAQHLVDGESLTARERRELAELLGPSAAKPRRPRRG